MSEKKNIETTITQAREVVVRKEEEAEQVNNVMERIENRDRRIFLDNLLKEFQEYKVGRLPSKSVFVSYSVRSGKNHFKTLHKGLKLAGFDVVTGFQKASGDGGSVLARILRQLKASTVYLGLLTKDMRVKRKHGRDQWSPSAWTMEEKGMALALGMPFVLLVQEGIYDDYWLKTAPDRIHFMFTSRNFKEKMGEAIGAVKDRYNELVGDTYDHEELAASSRSVLGSER
jgi:hypothetical protein